MSSVTVLTPPAADDRTGAPRESRGGSGHQPLSQLIAIVVAAAALGAAGIHFAVLGEHWQEWKLAGIFFGVVAWLQVAWAFAVLHTRSRAVLVLGIAGSLGVVAVWVVTRTSGLPFGPNAGDAEGAGFIDLLSCALEVLAACGAALLLLPRLAGRTVQRRAGLAAVGVLTLAIAVVTCAALIPSIGGPEAPGGASSMPMGGSAPMAAASDVPAGWNAGCMSMMHMEPGMAAGACTDAPVTPAQRAAAEKLVADTMAVVPRRYPTLQSAEAAGYQVINATGPLIHVGNPAYQTDGRMLDPNRVESLVYASFGKQSMLLGAMYIADPVGTPGPLIGGALTSWHIHTNLCVDARKLTALNPRANGTCAPGSAIGPTPQMLHVWTLPYDGGPFADLDPAALFKAVTNELQRRGVAVGQPGLS